MDNICDECGMKMDYDVCTCEGDALYTKRGREIRDLKEANARLIKERDALIDQAKRTVEQAHKERDDAKIQRDGWEETAAQMYEDAMFYRGLVTQIGELFGDAAKTCDDGSLSDDVLALKVPELVKALQQELSDTIASKDVEIHWLSCERERLIGDVQDEEARRKLGVGKFFHLLTKAKAEVERAKEDFLNLSSLISACQCKINTCEACQCELEAAVAIVNPWLKTEETS